MSRRNKRTDPKSDQAEQRRPARRAPAPLPEVMLARRPASVQPPAHELEAAPAPAVPATDAEPLAVVNKRVARIVGTPLAADDSELERRHLLARLLESEGPRAITRA